MGIGEAEPLAVVLMLSEGDRHGESIVDLLPLTEFIAVSLYVYKHNVISV